MYISTVNLLEQRRLPAYSFDSRMKLKDYDLNKIVGGLEEMLPGILPDGVEVTFDLADSELKIMGDSLKLKGAILNLIENCSGRARAGRFSYTEHRPCPYLQRDGVVKPVRNRRMCPCFDLRYGHGYERGSQRKNV